MSKAQLRGMVRERPNKTDWFAQRWERLAYGGPAPSLDTPHFVSHDKRITPVEESLRIDPSQSELNNARARALMDTADIALRLKKTDALRAAGLEEAMRRLRQAYELAVDKKTTDEAMGKLKSTINEYVKRFWTPHHAMQYLDTIGMYVPEAIIAASLNQVDVAVQIYLKVGSPFWDAVAEKLVDGRKGRHSPQSRVAECQRYFIRA